MGSADTGGGAHWVSRYAGPLIGHDKPAAVAASPDGARVLMTGWSIASGDGTDAVTIAYDARTGATLWTVRLNTAAIDVSEGLAVAPDGSTVYVVIGSGPDAPFADRTTAGSDW